MSQLSDSTDAYTMNTPPPIPTGPGLGAGQKKMLGISAAVLLLGGTAWAISQRPPENPDISDPAKTPADPETPTPLPPDVDVAGKVTDSMSFEQAFTAAREEVGMGGVFGWHGHWYNTFDKEEWSSLSLEQRQSYTEMITGEELPVKPYHPPVASNPTPATQPPTEPTAIEGNLNGQRVIGLDYNHDGVIDMLVVDSGDGNIYRVVDATGDDGLDTVYRYDSLDGELTAVVRLDQPVVLTNDQFSQGLEESMSREVVDSMLEPDASATETSSPADDETDESTGDGTTPYLASHETNDDTYVNNGNVQDMDH